jgi:hypothetical protein
MDDPESPKDWSPRGEPAPGKGWLRVWHADGDDVYLHEDKPWAYLDMSKCSAHSNGFCVLCAARLVRVAGELMLALQKAAHGVARPKLPRENAPPYDQATKERKRILSLLRRMADQCRSAGEEARTAWTESMAALVETDFAEPP